MVEVQVKNGIMKGIKMDDLLKFLKGGLVLLTEIAQFVLTLAIFVNVYNQDYEKALVFSVMVIAIQLENITNAIKNNNE